MQQYSSLNNPTSDTLWKMESFKYFPPSSLPLIETLLSIDPSERLTATAELNSEFFTNQPYACDHSSLPKYPPSKEMDARLWDEEARKLRDAGKSNAGGVKKSRARDRAVRAMPAPKANAELQANLDIIWAKEAEKCKSPEEAQHHIDKVDHLMKLQVTIPFYGEKSPVLQTGAELLCDSDMLLLGRTTIEEARSLLYWLDNEQV